MLGDSPLGKTGDVQKDWKSFLLLSPFLIHALRWGQAWLPVLGRLCVSTFGAKTTV
jgi:hypothetical protein